MSKDWLDSLAFTESIVAVVDAYNRSLADLGRDHALINATWGLKAKIREHKVLKLEWIPITKDPATWPAVGELVIVCDDVGFIRLDRRNEWKQIGDDCVSAFDNSAFYEQPIAWMPLPEPFESKRWKCDE